VKNAPLLGKIGLLESQPFVKRLWKSLKKLQVCWLDELNTLREVLEEYSEILDD